MRLYKVIYALNSKNDESELLMENLKSKYEEEKNLIISETNRKLEEFKDKFVMSKDQSRQIADLEAALEQYQIQK